MQAVDAEGAGPSGGTDTGGSGGQQRTARTAAGNRVISTVDPEAPHARTFPRRQPAPGQPAATRASGLDCNHITPIDAHKKQLIQQAPSHPSQVWTSR